MAEDEPVQPDEGQGGESGGSPFQEYLDRIPEEARDTAEEAFKAFDANTTRKFQEAAEYRKNWEPFEQLGVNQRSPEEVQWGLQFRDALDNPAAIKQWYEDYAKENNLTEQEQVYVDPDVETLVQQRLQEQLGPVSQQLADVLQWRETETQRQAEAQAQGFIESELSKLETEDGFDREKVDMFIPRHMDDPENAVRLAWQDYKTLRGQIEKDQLQAKLNQPLAAESGGSANGTPDAPANAGEAMKLASARALEQLRAANNS